MSEAFEWGGEGETFGELGQGFRVVKKFGFVVVEFRALVGGEFDAEAGGAVDVVQGAGEIVVVVLDEGGDGVAGVAQGDENVGGVGGEPGKCGLVVDFVGFDEVGRRRREVRRGEAGGEEMGFDGSGGGRHFAQDVEDPGGRAGVEAEAPDDTGHEWPPKA